jgi:hypothetical protein
MTQVYCAPRETREGMTVFETEANGDLWSTNEGVPFSIGLLVWCRHKRYFYPALSALVSPVQHIFFLTVHYFNLCVPIAMQLGQAVVQGHLSLNVCLRKIQCQKKEDPLHGAMEELKISATHHGRNKRWGALTGLPRRKQPSEELTAQRDGNESLERQ